MTRKTWKMSYIFTQVVCSNPEMTRKVNNLHIKLYILQHSSQWWFLSRTFVCFFSWLSFYWLSPNEVTFYRLNFLINPNKRNQKYETTMIFCYLTIFMDVKKCSINFRTIWPSYISIKIMFPTDLYSIWLFLISHKCHS